MNGLRKILNICNENDMMLDSVYCLCKADVRQLANNE
jgi:hypothetical protein